MERIRCPNPKLFLSKGALGFGLIQEKKEIRKGCFHFTHRIVRKCQENLQQVQCFSMLVTVSRAWKLNSLTVSIGMLVVHCMKLLH